MSSLLRGALFAMLIPALCAAAGCGESGDEPRDNALRDVEVRSLGAYNCMPTGLRRELRSLERRHDARVRQLARENPPAAGATAGDQQFRQIVESDRTRRRVLQRAQAIYKRYLPRGSDYDAACFLRESERARTRLESLGATGR